MNKTLGQLGRAASKAVKNPQKIEEHLRNAAKDPEKALKRIMSGKLPYRIRDDTNKYVSYSNMETKQCSERRTFMRGGTALDLYVEPGASFRGHHWRTMLKTMYADKLPSKFDLYHARGKVDMAALVHGNVHGNMTIHGYK